jgi:alpha-1,3/alpha-1,6-mannosyltransferase
MRILIIEDDNEASEYLVKAFREQGHVAEHAADGLAGYGRASEGGYDVLIVDQVAAVVPLLKMLLPGTRVLFYCHFPDLLLSQRSSVFKSLYRFPLDYLEQSSTGAADLILVNSNFTAGVFGQTFKRLARQGVEPAVLYPAVSIPSNSVLTEASKVWKKELSDEIVQFIGDKPVFLSINRWVVWVDLWVTDSVGVPQAA